MDANQHSPHRCRQAMGREACDNPRQVFEVLQNPLVAGPGPFLVFLRIHQFQIVEKQIRTFGDIQQVLGLGQAGCIDSPVDLQPAAGIEDFL